LNETEAFVIVRASNRALERASFLEVLQMAVMKQLVAILSVIAFSCVSFVGCYNTYYVPKAEFERLQSAESIDAVVVVKTDEGDGVEVNKDTGLFVRSLGGRRYPVTPFNFRITRSQMVASDRDTLLALSEVDSFEVDHISIGWTATLIAVGAAAMGGVIAGVILTTEGNKGFK